MVIHKLCYTLSKVLLIECHLANRLSIINILVFFYEVPKHKLNDNRTVGNIIMYICTSGYGRKFPVKEKPGQGLYELEVVGDCL